MKTKVTVANCQHSPHVLMSSVELRNKRIWKRNVNSTPSK